MSSDDEMRGRRASSFGSQAAAYAEHRPGYAPDAVGWALAPVRGRDPLRVLDIGAGTGKLTGSIERLAAAPDWAGELSLVAVEPDPAMMAELRRVMPGVTAWPGRAEEIPLPDGSVDAVMCGQAAHWFDMARAVPEIGRVLTAGGVFAGLWNMDDDSASWVAGLTQIYRPNSSYARWRQAGHNWPSAEPGGRGPFGPTEQAEFPHSQMHTIDSLVGLIATHSRQLVMDPADRERELAEVRGYLQASRETENGEFRMPMLTAVLRAVKTVQ